MVEDTKSIVDDGSCCGIVGKNMEKGVKVMRIKLGCADGGRRVVDRESSGKVVAFRASHQSFMELLFWSGSFVILFPPLRVGNFWLYCGGVSL